MARDIEASSIASHIDLFFDELHRIDVAYSDYARRAGVSDNVMCILDYLKDHDGASQRAICEYTLLPRQDGQQCHRIVCGAWVRGAWGRRRRSSGQNGPFHACRAQILQQLDRAESRRGVSGDERAS
ncbi:hypothetical protein [Bifidobacterium bifidum]|uniref:hypothetical protein n=1 Tax=Bifidobacterium bifidum TaxID=1681 RepID=UPI001EFA22F8|nr:hypothetical protein [Bifidobacterium bifidum]